MVRTGSGRRCSVCEDKVLVAFLDVYKRFLAMIIRVLKLETLSTEM
jgi:hypothetical protein